LQRILAQYTTQRRSSKKMLQTWSLENNFIGFRNIDNHFVISSPLLDMLKFTQKTYIGISRYQKVNVVCIFKHNVATTKRVQVTFHHNIQHRSHTRSLNYTSVDVLLRGKQTISFNRLTAANKKRNYPVLYAFW